MAQLVETDPGSVVSRLRLSICGEVLRHLELFKCLEVSDPYDNGSQLAIARDTDALPCIHGTAEHIGKLTA